RAAPAQAQVATLAPSDSLLAPDGVAGDGFGLSLSADGDRLAVGAPWAPGGGAVYVYERGPGGWALAARVTGQGGTDFGLDVALSGDRLAVAPYAGGVAIAERQPDGSWAQAALLPAEYAGSVALDGDVV